MEHLFRKQSGKMQSILMNIFGFEHHELIEDVIQDTFFAALKHWGMKELPENPEAWLTKVAKRKLLNELQRVSRHGKLNKTFAIEHKIEAIPTDKDEENRKREQIKALFVCCAPFLSTKSQIMLTLRIVAGFGDKEISRALHLKESAVKKAIYRAKNSFRKKSDFSFEIQPAEYQKRLDVVLHVLYLMFNEGYQTTKGELLLREDLAFEAIQLTKWLLDFKDLEQGKNHALLALMYFNIARFESRIDSDDQLISFENQDRTSWDQELINQGIRHLRHSRISESLSKYHLEGSIACEHCVAKSFEETNWNHISQYYKMLLILDESIQVKLNYAIALGESGEYEQGLSILMDMEQAGNTRSNILMGALARIHHKMGNIETARSYYMVAMDLSNIKREKQFFLTKIEGLLLTNRGSTN